MDESQIEALAMAFRTSKVYWEDGSGSLRPLTGVSATPLDLEGDGLPVPVAFLEKGYIDLENVDPRTLVVGQRLFPI